VNWRPWDVELTRQAERDLGQLAQRDAERLLDAIEDYAATGQGDVRRLTSRPGEWRIRVGDVRAIFGLDRDGRRLIVTRVAPRGRAYR
jgi:mRNA-degrading endonuclease RelE of RelBE toxin-antitoxin system